MIREPDRHRIGKARLLRRQGKTYEEIRDVVGAVDKDTLVKWLRGIPRPPETFRARKHDALAREVRRLRAQGLTHSEIVEKTGASDGSVSLWMRGVAVPGRAAERHQERLTELRLRGARARHEYAERARLEQIAESRSQLGVMSDRDLLIAGTALYWAEGSKSKLWRPSRRVQLINSDVGVIRVFLAWLDLMGIPAADRLYRLSIHETGAVSEQEAWWAGQLDLGAVRFDRATIKRHIPKPTNRRHVGSDYRGCLVVTVRRSTRLYDRVDGFWQAISGGTPEGRQPRRG